MRYRESKMERSTPHLWMLEPWQADFWWKELIFYLGIFIVSSEYVHSNWYYVGLQTLG